jgi:predicted transcriptional regulator
MARPRSAALTDAELRIMRVLWDRGRATVGEVVECMDGPRKPAYNTVLTMLGILEEKRLVKHHKVGRAFAYEPLIGRGDARRSALSHVLHRFFDNSPEALILNLLGREDADPVELQQIRTLLASSPAADRAFARKPGR